MNARPRPQRIPEKLLAIRKRLGLSQTGMMRRLNIKCCYTRISEFETGRRQPNLLTLLAYARAAGIHMDDLIDDSVSLFEKGGVER
jgi:transcriptional regulator with XRE-family HTH domain